MIKVTNEVKVYEVDKQEIKSFDYPVIKINSHGNYNDRVNIEIDGKIYTVIANDLKAAIDNATNINRW